MSKKKNHSRNQDQELKMEKKIKNAILSDCLSEFETATKPDGDLYKKIFSYLSDVFYQETVKEVEVTDIEYGASYPIYDTQINYNSEDENKN